MTDLTGRSVLALVTNRGVEQDELKFPAEKLRDAGVKVTVAAPETGEIQSLTGDWDLGEKFTADIALKDVNPSDYDLVLLPGGTLNADALRLDEDAQRIVKDFASNGRPVAAICHGPWLLVESELLDGKTMTSYISVRKDVENAGATWKDVEVFECPCNSWDLITSRNPGDLEAFTSAIQKRLSK